MLAQPCKVAAPGEPAVVAPIRFLTAVALPYGGRLLDQGLTD